MQRPQSPALRATIGQSAAQLADEVSKSLAVNV
jgi:hypothetical protein